MYIIYIYLLSNPSSISISGVTEEHTVCIGTNLVLVQCILSLTNGCWSCRGMPGHGIPDIGMPMVAANWALGVVSPLLGQVLLVGIVLPTPGQALLWALSCPRWASRHCQGQGGVPYDFRYPYSCQLLLSIVAAGITHRAAGCWHCYCWLSMALSWQWQ